MKRTLIIFAKTPVPGAVKTRLIRKVGEEGACALYTAFLRDTAAEIADFGGNVRWYATPDPSPVAALIDRRDVRPQASGGLGRRMRAAFDEAFHDGSEAVVIIGTDTPELTASEIENAFSVLEAGSSVAIGPALDGGYYLLGLRPGPTDFFERVTYSRQDVLERTLAELGTRGASAFHLGPCLDVDTPDDLEILAHRLSEGRDSTSAALRHTRAAFQKLGLLNGPRTFEVRGATG